MEIISLLILTLVHVCGPLYICICRCTSTTISRPNTNNKIRHLFLPSFYGFQWFCITSVNLMMWFLMADEISWNLTVLTIGLYCMAGIPVSWRNALIVMQYMDLCHVGIVLGMGSANERRHYYGSFFILGMGSPNERWRYIVTPPLIGLAHTQNNPLSW